MLCATSGLSWLRHEDHKRSIYVKASLLDTQAWQNTIVFESPYEKSTTPIASFFHVRGGEEEIATVCAMQNKRTNTKSEHVSAAISVLCAPKQNRALNSLRMHMNNTHTFFKRQLSLKKKIFFMHVR